MSETPRPKLKAKDVEALFAFLKKYIHYFDCGQDELTTARARIAELEAALEPFAKANAVAIALGSNPECLGKCDYAVGFNAPVGEQPKFAWFGRARAALKREG